MPLVNDAFVSPARDGRIGFDDFPATLTASEPVLHHCRSESLTGAERDAVMRAAAAFGTALLRNA